MGVHKHAHVLPIQSFLARLSAPGGEIAVFNSPIGHQKAVTLRPIRITLKQDAGLALLGYYEWSCAIRYHQIIPYSDIQINWPSAHPDARRYAISVLCG